MDLRQRVFGEISTRSGQEVVSIDVGSLIRRLLLFDQVIVKSFNLRELPLLVRTFGKTGFQELLASGIIKFSCESSALITDLQLNGVRTIPINHFTFATSSVVDQDANLRKEFGALRRVTGLKNHDRDAIENAVWESLVRPPDRFAADLLQQTDADIRSASPSLKTAINGQLRKEFILIGDAYDALEIEVEEPQSRVFHVRTNISRSFGLAPDKTHLLLQRSVTAVANLNHRLEEMSAYNAITGFLEEEAPLLFGKIAGILALQNPKIAEEQFKRVIEVANIADFRLGEKIDVAKLLKARQSADCRDFRDWLSNSENLSDEEIRRMARGMRSVAGTIASSSIGKAVRLAATTLVGLYPPGGIVLGIAAGAVDSFLVDRVLPRSGILAFLTETYPSLFKSA